MIAKFCALGAVAAAAAIAGQAAVSGDAVPAPNAAAQAVVLLPDTINGAPIRQRWHNDRPQAIVEEGALYSAQPQASLAEPGEAVQLDFFRNARRAHNAAFCGIAQGERLRSETFRSVRTRSGAAVFDVALLSADQQLRLVAATECAGNGCMETRRLVAAPWDGWSWRSVLAPDHEAVVPTSIVLVRRQLDSEAAMARAEQEMLGEFERAAGDLDLAPAQHLATLLDGAGT